MKHIVKLSTIASSCGLGLFLVGCDAAVDCDKVVPKQKSDECRQEQYRSQNNINTTNLWLFTFIWISLCQLIHHHQIQ